MMMISRKKEVLEDHPKYGKIFKLLEKYGGGINKWEERNRKISGILELMS
jgi:hypothetical protein